MSFLSFPNPTIIVFQIQPSIENAFNKYFLDCEHEQIKLKISSFLWGHWMSQILGAQRSDKKAWGNLNCKNSMGGSGLVAKLFPTFETPMDCSPPGSPVHGILQAGILEWVSHFLLQRIFLTQGLNLGLVHCRQILYQLSHQRRLIYREKKKFRKSTEKSG